MARTMSSSSDGADEERPVAARRAGELAHGEERHRDQQPALGAAGEREREAEQQPVEHDEGVRELGRPLARDADGVDAERTPARAGAAAARWPSASASDGEEQRRRGCGSVLAGAPGSRRLRGGRLTRRPSESCEA